MPVLTEQQEDALVAQIIAIFRAIPTATISIRKVLRKLETNLNTFINNFEP